MNLVEFLSRGQDRRSLLDNFVRDLNIERYIPPQFRPATEFVLEANPVQAMGNAMQAGGVVFDADATADARKRAAVDMGVEMAMSLAPAALVRAGYLAAPTGLIETFAAPTGEVVGPMVRNAASDLQYAGRSLAEGDLGGIFDAFRPSRDAQSLSAAGIGDNGGPPLNDVRYIPARASLFSPSLRAAENLKQNKGTYEQMRGMLLKGGGKEAELQWSGMDRAFAGQKVTKDDLISYLRENDPRLQATTAQAFGKIGGEQPEDFDEWFSDVIESDRPLVSQEVDHYAEFLGEDLYYEDGVTAGVSLDEDELYDIVERTGLDTQEVIDANYIIDRGGENVALYEYSSDAARDYYGEDNLEQMALESLRETLEYDFHRDPEDLFDRLGRGSRAQAFDRQDTRYSEYMPEGAENYQENTFQYRDPTGQFSDDLVAGASHFGESDANTQYHTRVGDYETTNTVGGRPFKARYVAEIQSDAQQNSDPSLAMTYDQGVDKTRIGQALLPFKDAEDEATSKRYEAERKLSNAIEDLRQKNVRNNGKNYFNTAAKINVLNRAIKTHARQASFNDNGREIFPLLGDGEFGPMDEVKVDWANVTEADLFDLYEKYNLASISEHNSDFIEAARDVGDLSLLGLDSVDISNINDAIAEVNATKAARKSAQLATNEKEIELEKTFLDKHGVLPHRLNHSGPMMASQNRWVDDAIRRSIIDAVNDDSVDFLAFPKDEQAIGKVGGSYDPKEGTVDFYNRDVQNRLRGILKKIDKDARIQEIGIASNDDQTGDFDAYGLRITPEFRRRVKEQGLPTFAAIGAANLAGVFDYLREQKEKRNERIGGILGYQF